MQGPAKRRNWWIPLLLGAIAGCQSTPVVPEYIPPPSPPGTEQTTQFVIGRFAYLTNDPVTAAENYTAALKGMDVPDASLLERAIFANLRIGDIKTASRLVEQFSGGDIQEAALARLIYGVDQLRDGRYRSAAALLTTDDFGPFNELLAESAGAWALLEAESLEVALARLDTKWNPAPAFKGMAYANRGLLAVAARNDEVALQSFEAMLGEDYRVAIAIEQYARLLGHLGRTDDARKILLEYRQTRGSHPVIDDLFVRIASGKKISRPRISAKQGAGMAIFLPAATLAGQTNGEVASVYYALALYLNNDLDVARTLWAAAIEDAGRTDEAIELLEGVRKRSPFYAAAQSQIARALLNDGRRHAAIQTAREALKSKPSRDLKIQLGGLFQAVEDHAAAIDVFSEIIESDAALGVRDWRMLFTRGTEYDKIGAWDTAEADLLAATQLNPRQADVLNYLGYRWIERGENIERALEMIKIASEERPGASHIIDSLGWAYYTVGDFESAVGLLERAVELEPANPLLNDHLGDAYWQVGRRLEAGFQWKRVLKLGAEPDLIASVEEKLDRGLVTDPAGQVAEVGAG